MKFKRIAAIITAAAITVGMTALNAFASTVTLDTEYTGAWSLSSPIPTADLEAVGGDVKVTLTVETRNLLSDQFLINPLKIVDSWVSLTDVLTSDSVVAKTDGWFCIPENSTTCEFVISADTISELGDAGLNFQVQNVIIKSAELESGSAQGTIRRLDDANGKLYCFGATYEELTGTAPAEETLAVEESVEEVSSPVADSQTSSTGTGNLPAIAMVSVMTVSAFGVMVAKKRK